MLDSVSDSRQDITSHGRDLKGHRPQGRKRTKSMGEKKSCGCFGLHRVGMGLSLLTDDASRNRDEKKRSWRPLAAGKRYARGSRIHGEREGEKGEKSDDEVDEMKLDGGLFFYILVSERAAAKLERHETGGPHVTRPMGPCGSSWLCKRRRRQDARDDRPSGCSLLLYGEPEISLFTLETVMRLDVTGSGLRILGMYPCRSWHVEKFPGRFPIFRWKASAILLRY